MFVEDSTGETDVIIFFLNGKRHSVQAPHPNLMLIDYLRSPEIGLTGPKKPCGQGGCGGCAVVLSHWDDKNKKAIHASINACLRPVAALNGLSVMTIEGTGSVETAMNKVAHRLAINNGTQCGYCTNGWVMAMTGFLANNPEKKTKKDIEALFDGNICRCTGYRSILEGMKTFASDWTAEDEKNRMKCLVDRTFDADKVKDTVEITFPKGAKSLASPVKSVAYQTDGKIWAEANTLDDLIILAQKYRKNDVRLINGNTSFGIYKQEVEAADVFIDIRGISELHGIRQTADQWVIGAGVSYASLVEELETIDAEKLPGPLASINYMARRTAGSLVRNTATIGGNTMMVLKHIHTGEPFPSDMATALCGIDASVKIKRISKRITEVLLFSDLIKKCWKSQSLAGDIILVEYHVPLGHEASHFMAQKTALREVNSHSIVNCTTRIELASNGKNVPPSFGGAIVALGGIAPYAWRAEQVEKFLYSKSATLDTIQTAITLLGEEVGGKLSDSSSRLENLPNEGFTNAYRTELAQTYLYKALLKAWSDITPEQVPTDVQSATKNYWGTWPVSKGSQSYQTDYYKAPLSEPYIKLMAMYQVQGEVHYTHETQVTYGTLFGALVVSVRANGTYQLMHPKTKLKKISVDELSDVLAQSQPGFAQLITDNDIPENGTIMNGSAHDQPLLLGVGKPIMYAGQALMLVLADSQRTVEALAEYIGTFCLTYQQDPNGDNPVLTIAEAIEKDWIFPDSPASASYMAHIWKVTRPGSDLGWILPQTPSDCDISHGTGTVDRRNCLVIASSQKCGSQLHFYMETQASVAEWRDGETLMMHSSTQSPKTVQGAVSSTLGIAYNQIGIKVKQLGGGYGGKTEQSRFVGAMTALATAASNKPVHVALTREADSASVGRRHPYFGQYQLAVDPGTTNPNDKGKILGLNANIWGDGGAFYDCSFIVSDCIQLRADNAYYIPNYNTQIDVCRTNTAPNTAYRAFGDIQGTLLLENAIEDAAVLLKMDAADLRAKNLYQLGQTTPGGQPLEYCYMQEVWNYARKKANYDARKKAVDTYNAENKWRKRGLCLIPLKYGSGFNLVMLEQTTALISVYESDGTILVKQGGVDMGQGMLTKITQIAAYELNVPLEIIRIDSSDTTVIPNPSSTGASTGTQYNGAAVKQCCHDLKKRLEKFCDGMRELKGDKWCKQNHINHWDYKTGWNTMIQDSGKTIWQFVVLQAFTNRVNLQVQTKVKIPGGEGNVPNISFKPYDQQPTGTGIAIDANGAFSETVNPYVGFTFSAACAEVEVDILTGETKILRVDLVYDMGKSLNPAIDVGQIEGAFMQGVGYVMTEDVVYQLAGLEKGKMNALNTWCYKPPAISTVPLEMNVTIFPRELANKAPENPNTLFSSKEVGEPPLVLANTVFFAIKDAIRASRRSRGLSPLFSMPAPATVQTVRTACAIDASTITRA